MLGKRADKPGSGVAEQGKIIAFHRAGHTDTTMPSRLFAPPKLFLATADDEAALEHGESLSPTSTLQAGSPTQVPFSRGGSSGGDDCRSKGNSRRRPCEARPVGLGLAGTLNGEVTGAATTIMTGQTLRPVHNAPRSNSPEAYKELGANSCRTDYSPRQCLLPSEMEASEEYTHGPHPRTVHRFEDYVGIDSGGLSARGGGEGDFLRWCHGCSKDLGLGKDIFMYRGDMGFCSYECRYRKMLFDEKL